MRVQIPAYTDRWMMGDRYGELVDTRWAAPKKGADKTNIAHVKLDISKKVVRVILDDCVVV
jgi:hypothetical protein